MCDILKRQWLYLTACTRILPGIPVLLSAMAFADDGQFGWTSGSPTTGSPTTGSPTTGSPTTGSPTTGSPTTAAADSDSTVGSVLPNVSSLQQPLYRPSDPGFSNHETMGAESYPGGSISSRLLQASHQVAVVDSDLPQESPSAAAPVNTSTDASGANISGTNTSAVNAIVETNAVRPFFELNPPTDQDQLGSSSAGESAESGSEVLIRGMAWLIVTLCLLSLTILGLRRWQRSHGLLPTTNGRSRVLETLSLGPGRTISLIEMNGLRALVGSDAGGIRTIVLAPASFEDEIRQADGPDLRLSSIQS